MTTASNDEIRILTPSGMLGYELSGRSLQDGLAKKPSAMAPSTDSGPQEAWTGGDDLQPRSLREGHRGPARGQHEVRPRC